MIRSPSADLPPMEERMGFRLLKKSWNVDNKWLLANEYRSDMVDCVYQYEEDLDKLKVMVETMEKESLSEVEWGAVLDLIKTGATFETAMNEILSAK
tara:strand:+ start:768 stop:1058 length:291 start_codon:yes stop_codon:yes gene_type:complete